MEGVGCRSRSKGNKRRSRPEARQIPYPNYQGSTVATPVMRKWCELRCLPKADPETTVWVLVVYFRGNAWKHK